MYSIYYLSRHKKSHICTSDTLTYFSESAQFDIYIQPKKKKKHTLGHSNVFICFASACG